MAAAMGDLFAPPDRAAAQAWQDRKFNVNAGNIDQTRQAVGFPTGNPGGMVDPQALKAMSQGGPYDFGARRNAIAAAVQQQAAAAAAQPVVQPVEQQPVYDAGFGGYYGGG